jgi:hypothetical protein
MVPKDTKHFADLCIFFPEPPPPKILTYVTFTGALKCSVSTRSNIDGARIGVNMRDDASLRLVYSSLSNHQRGISSIGDIGRSINILTPLNIAARPTIFNCDFGMELENVEAPFLEYINFKKKWYGIKTNKSEYFFCEIFTL